MGARGYGFGEGERDLQVCGVRKSVGGIGPAGERVCLTVMNIMITNL